ncbi:MAG: TetR/AcrR family transcriptional regulator [Clostridiales bacterium]|nr:TetR/AcrR family transcriptional regulator [Clostridiales bacterium]
MPKIFTQEDRDVLREKMLDTGLKLLESKRYKYISVEEVALEVGVAKGTFYNFFDSKEAFFYEIMQRIKEKNREPLKKLSPRASIDEITECLYYRYTHVKTVYEYFTTEEIKQIVRKLPDGDVGNDSESFAQELFGKLEKYNGKPEVIVSMFHILALASSDNSIKGERGYKASMKQYCKALAEYIVNGDNV